MKKSKKDLLVSALQIPKDISKGAILLWVTGNEQICLENYHCIVTYTQSLICIQAKHCKVVIEGKELKIDYYTNEIMQISGCINTITYQ
jgi:sporulation protein YqfC